MIFKETSLKGAFVLELEQFEDERGFFANSWTRDEFLASNFNINLSQCSVSFNKKKGTLRGMHYQLQPYQESKVVRCTMGKIYDVIIDLRKNSPTFKKWFSIQLDAQNRLSLYVPEGFAHGFLTLENNSEVFYQICGDYHPEASRGVRWNDPAFGIKWPAKVKVINLRDSGYPDFKEHYGVE